VRITVDWPMRLSPSLLKATGVDERVTGAVDVGVSSDFQSNHMAPVRPMKIRGSIEPRWSVWQDDTSALGVNGPAGLSQVGGPRCIRSGLLAPSPAP